MAFSDIGEGILEIFVEAGAEPLKFGRFDGSESSGIHYRQGRRKWTKTKKRIRARRRVKAEKPKKEAKPKKIGVIPNCSICGARAPNHTCLASATKPVFVLKLKPVQLSVFERSPFRVLSHGCVKCGSLALHHRCAVTGVFEELKTG